MITVTKPVGKPENLTAYLVEGGSLEPNTTYYLCVTSYDGKRTTPVRSSNTGLYHSDISDEISITTTETALSIQLDWDIPEGAGGYCCFISTTSKDYFQTPSLNKSSIDGLDLNTNSYLITETTVNSYNRFACHSIQLEYNLAGNLSKDIGTIKVEISGDDDYVLDDIYKAIIDAGYSENVWFDNQHLIVKGSFIFSSGSGSFIMSNQTLTLEKGVIWKTDDEFTVKIGSKYSDEIGVNPKDRCVINIHSPREALYLGSKNADNPIHINGCTINIANSVSNSTSYYLNNAYNGAQIPIICGNIENFENNTLHYWSQFRGYYGNMKNTEYARVHFPTATDHINCSFYHLNYLHTSWKKSMRFFNCAILPVRTSFDFFMTGNTSYDYLYRHFYDCTFVADDNMVVFNVSKSANIDQTAYVFYSLDLTIKDKNDNPIEDVTVAIKDNNGNNVVKYLYDKEDYNRVTNEETSNDLTSNTRGTTYCYLNFYNAKHDWNGDYSSHTTQMKYLSEYPYTVTISKKGYETFQITLSEPKAYPINIVLTDEVLPVYVETSINGSINEISLNGTITNNNLNTYQLLETTLTGFLEEVDNLQNVIDNNNINGKM